MSRSHGLGSCYQGKSLGGISWHEGAKNRVIASVGKQRFTLQFASIFYSIRRIPRA